MGSIGIKELLVVLVIVVLVFGTKRLGSLGADLGAAIRGFRKSMQDDDKPDEKRLPEQEQDRDVIQGEVQRSEEKR